MILSQHTLQLLIELGAPADKLAAVLRAIEQDAADFSIPSEIELERRRSQDRERQRRSRDRHVTSRESRDPYPPKIEPDQSSNTENNQTPNPPPYKSPRPCPNFEAFWAEWPDKRNKGAARRAWPAATRKAHPSEIIAAVANVTQTHAWQDGLRVHAATWLNGERWADPPEDHARAPPFSASQMQIASDEWAYREACRQIEEQNGPARNHSGNQGVVVSLPAPRQIASR